MGMLWFFQTVFLEQYYESEMEKKIQTAVSSLSLQYSVSETLDLESYLQEIGTISNANDMYFFIEAEDESFNISSTDQGSAGRYYYGRSGVDLARERLLANNGEPVTFKISNQTGEVVTQVYAAKVDSQYRPNVRFYAFAPLTPMGPAVGILAKQLLTVTAISLVVAGILALYISSRIARPITGITKQAAELAEGHYDVEFEGSSYREINDLAGTLNTTAEALSKTDQLQRDLMANVSHDLRTPITMVRSYAEMIRDLSGDNPEKRNEHLGVIIEESDRLNTLVNDILTGRRGDHEDGTCGSAEMRREHPGDLPGARGAGGLYDLVGNAGRTRAGERGRAPHAAGAVQPHLQRGALQRRPQGSDGRLLPEEKNASLRGARQGHRHRAGGYRKYLEPVREGQLPGSPLQGGHRPRSVHHEGDPGTARREIRRGKHVGRGKYFLV